MVWSSKDKQTRDDKQKKAQNTLVEEPLHAAKILNYNRYFSNDDQMNRYLDDFAARAMVDLKIMDFQFFDLIVFNFKTYLKFKDLTPLFNLIIHTSQIWLSNLSTSNDGKLCSKVNNIKIRVRAWDWLTIANLKYHEYKCKAKDLMSIPYFILVTKILEHHRIDGVDEGEIILGSYNRSNAHILNKINIKHING
ncbi:hypothetical protein CR513_62809, partial [Mucuna pruriens]